MLKHKVHDMACNFLQPYATDRMSPEIQLKRNLETKVQSDKGDDQAWACDKNDDKSPEQQITTTQTSNTRHENTTNFPYSIQKSQGRAARFYRYY